MLRLIGKFFVLILLSIITILNTAFKIVDFFLSKLAPFVALVMIGVSIYLFCTKGFSMNYIWFIVWAVALVAISYILPFVIRKIDSWKDSMFEFIKRKKVKKDYEYYKRINEMANSDYFKK